MPNDPLTEADLLPEPVKPEAWECCSSDCGDACIQTRYWQEKARYDEQQKRWRAQQDTLSENTATPNQPSDSIGTPQT